MPLFEFRCRDCRHEFETLVRTGESTDCPECGSRQADKLFSVPAAHVASGALPVTSACPPSDAPPCSPHCCRIPS